MAGDAARMAEAEKLMKEAKKATTKSLTRWTLDWDSAAGDYEKAALIYSNCGRVPQAKEAYDLAAIAHDKAGNPFLAARCMENLATLLKDNGQSDVAPEVYVKASVFFARDNKPQQQADCLVKAARLVPASQSQQAIQWIKDGVDALEDSDRTHLALDLYRSLVQQQLRSNRPVDAIQTLKSLVKATVKMSQPSAIPKIGLEIIVLCISLGDTVLANREFQELCGVDGFRGREQALCYDLIAAAESRDQERLAELGKDQLITFCTVDVARLAKKLAVPAGPPIQRPGGAAVPASAAAGGLHARDEDDTN